MAQSGFNTMLVPILQRILPLMLHLPSSSHQQRQWVAFGHPALCSQILLKMMLHSEEENHPGHLTSCCLPGRRDEHNRLVPEIQSVSAGGGFVFRGLVHAYAAHHCGFNIQSIFFFSWSNTEIALKAELMFGILPIFCSRAADVPVPSYFYDLKMSHFRHLHVKKLILIFLKLNL